MKPQLGRASGISAEGTPDVNCQLRLLCCGNFKGIWTWIREMSLQRSTWPAMHWKVRSWTCHKRSEFPLRGYAAAGAEAEILPWASVSVHETMALDLFTQFKASDVIIETYFKHLAVYYWYNKMIFKHLLRNVFMNSPWLSTRTLEPDFIFRSWLPSDSHVTPQV